MPVTINFDPEMVKGETEKIVASTKDGVERVDALIDQMAKVLTIAENPGHAIDLMAGATAEWLEGKGIIKKEHIKQVAFNIVIGNVAFLKCCLLKGSKRVEDIIETSLERMEGPETPASREDTEAFLTKLLQEES